LVWEAQFWGMRRLDYHPQIRVIATVGGIETGVRKKIPLARRVSLVT